MKPIPPGTLEKMPTPLLGLSSLLGIGCIVMHSIGVVGLQEEYGVVLPKTFLIETLATLTTGPLLVVIVSCVLLTLHLRKKQLPKWLILIGGLGAAFSVNALRGGLAHDLGHIVFNRCAGSPYGAIVFWSSLTSAASMALAGALSAPPLGHGSLPAARPLP